MKLGYQNLLKRFRLGHGALDGGGGTNGRLLLCINSTFLRGSIILSLSILNNPSAIILLQLLSTMN